MLDSLSQTISLGIVFGRETSYCFTEGRVFQVFGNLNKVPEFLQFMRFHSSSLVIMCSRGCKLLMHMPHISASQVFVFHFEFFFSLEGTLAAINALRRGNHIEDGIQ